MFKNLINKLKKLYKMHRNGYIEINEEIENYLLNKENELYEFCGFPIITYYKWSNGSAIRYFIAYNLKHKKILKFRVPNWYKYNHRGEREEFENLKYVKDISDFKDLTSLKIEFLSMIKNKNLKRLDKQIKHFEFEVKRVYKEIIEDNYHKESIYDNLFGDDRVIRIIYEYYYLDAYNLYDRGFSFNDLNILADNLKKLKCICIDNLSYLYERFPELLINDNLNKN